MEEHELDTLDLGTYAEVGLMATDDDGIYTDGQRKLTLTTVAGDNTAVVHVENNMWLNIDFNSTAILSFDVTLYEVRGIFSTLFLSSLKQMINL